MEWGSHFSGMMIRWVFLCQEQRNETCDCTDLPFWKRHMSRWWLSNLNKVHLEQGDLIGRWWSGNPMTSMTSVHLTLFRYADVNINLFLYQINVVSPSPNPLHLSYFHGFLEPQSAFNTREPRPSVVLGPYQQGFCVHDGIHQWLVFKCLFGTSCAKTSFPTVLGGGASQVMFSLYGHASKWGYQKKLQIGRI